MRHPTPGLRRLLLPLAMSPQLRACRRPARLKFGPERFCFFDRDHALVADLLHCLGDHPANLAVIVRCERDNKGSDGTRVMVHVSRSTLWIFRSDAAAQWGSATAAA